MHNKIDKEKLGKEREIALGVGVGLTEQPYKLTIPLKTWHCHNLTPLAISN
jgi:hypothetical protein